MIKKILDAIRFLFYRLIHPGRFKAEKLGLIGKGGYFRIVNGGNIFFKGRVILMDYTEIQSNEYLELGHMVSVNKFSRIIAHEKIVIGNNVTIAQFVSILDHDHHFEMVDGSLKIEGYTTAPISIGNNVWISDKCTILKGVTIGNNVIIGAHTLVNKDVPDNSVIAGTPFKIVKKL